MLDKLSTPYTIQISTSTILPFKIQHWPKV